jgi:hypothetical protein
MIKLEWYLSVGGKRTMTLALYLISRASNGSQ